MFSIQVSKSDELTEIDQLVDEIHSLVDRLVSRATDGERESVEEIELIRDEQGILIKGDIPKANGPLDGEVPNDGIRGGVLIDLPFDERRPGRIVA